MELESSNDWDDKVLIKSCLTATPAARIRRWRTRLRNNILLKVNSTPVKSIDDAISAIQKHQSEHDIILHVGQSEKTGIHEEEGIPMLYFDQLNMIAEHLHNIKYDRHDNNPSHPPTTSTHKKAAVMVNMLKAYWEQGTLNGDKAQIPKAIISKGKQRGLRLTRKKLKKEDDWKHWNYSEFKQLDQYRDQDTFGEPCELP